MKQNYKYLVPQFFLLVLVFSIGKLTFMAYNHEIHIATVSEMLGVLWYGLPLDLRTAAILLIPPALCCAIMKKGLHYILIPYIIIMAFVVGAIFVADMVMYEFWQFKLSSVVLSYAASPEGTTNSVSISFILTRILMSVAFIAIVAVPSIWLAPWRLDGRRMLWPLIVLVAISILPIGVRNCYHRGPLFLSHAATNPVFRFATSFRDSQRFASLASTSSVYRNDIATSKTIETYETSPAVTDTLLSTKRPSILIVQLESFGGNFVKELGGIPDVAPNLSRLIPEGIFWDQYYSNSFRTDRGTVCAYSGWISYPTISPMKDVAMHPQLSSMPRTLHNAGYQTGYMYAGAMTNMGKYQYVADMGFEAIMDEKYFTSEELNSSWGANDSTAAMKMFHTIAEVRPDAQWFMVWQTVSSHEPWDVPYHRLEDKKLNAFAYTDECLGQLVDSLRTLPAWDNMLVIVIPDHGFLYQQTYDDSEFFHSPMLWLGGAVKQPRRMSVLMNQSDIAATLFAQMEIPFDEYPWSRNVLAPDYKPFVYCNYPAGLLYKDSTGETLYDLTAQRPIPIGEPADDTRLRKALEILKASYESIK